MKIVLLLIVSVMTVFGMEYLGMTTINGYDVPLRNVDVKADVIDSLAKVEIRQTYVNLFGQVVDVEYTFPVDDAAVVSDITVYIDDKTIKTVVKEIGQAREEYDEGVEMGAAAYLVEHYGDYMILRLGNIDVGKKVEVVITYLTELSLEGQDYLFVLPSVVAPRYGAPEKAHADSIEYTDDADFLLNIEVNFDMSNKIESISSPSHENTIHEIDTKKGKVSLSGMVLDRDFVVKIKTEGTDTPHIWLEHNNCDSTMAMLTFNTDSLSIEKSPVPKEIMFIIDTSGSMMGDNIISAKKALIDSLKLLEKSYEDNLITFNIIEFSSSNSALFESSQRPNPEMIQKAIHFVENLVASGGTKLLAAMEEAYALNANSEKENILIVITDGEIFETEELFDLITEKSKVMNVKVFSIGIGHAVSRYLVNGIARVGNGISEFVLPGKNFEDLLTRMVERIHDEIITITSIEWGSDYLDFVTPSRNTSIYKSMIISKYAHFKTESTNIENVKLHFSNGQSLTISSIDHKNGNVIHNLGVWKRIQELSDVADSLNGEDGVVEAIVSLSTKYNLLSRFTSMIAVDHTVEINTKEKQQCSVPLHNLYQSENYHSGDILFLSVTEDYDSGDILLLDVTVLSLGIGINKKFSSLLPRNSMIPNRKHSDLVISVPNSGELEVELFGCGGDIEDITDTKCVNVQTETILFPTYLAGQDIIVQITLEIDVNSLVTLKIEHNNTILLNTQFLDYQISEDAIESMIRECNPIPDQHK